MIEKIDVQTLGEFITEYRDGKPYTSSIVPMIACKQLADKLNEIIDHLNRKA
jgi:hypothetical protein